VSGFARLIHKGAILNVLDRMTPERPVAFVADLVREGASARAIRRAVAGGELVDHGKGLVSTPDAAEDPDFQDAAACLVCDGGILCRRSAAMRHGLVTDLPDRIEVLVPENVTRRSTFLPIQLVRSKMPESFEVGIESRTALGIPVRTTSPARTVVDLWRGWRAPHLGVPVQHQQEAIHAYLSGPGSPDELVRVARLFGPAVERRIEIAVETFLNHPTRGM
jgi:predicted transcriptional regulator of viral defense system